MKMPLSNARRQSSWLVVIPQWRSRLAIRLIAAAIDYFSTETAAAPRPNPSRMVEMLTRFSHNVRAFDHRGHNDRVSGKDRLMIEA